MSIGERNRHGAPEGAVPAVELIGSWPVKDGIYTHVRSSASLDCTQVDHTHAYFSMSKYMFIEH